MSQDVLTSGTDKPGWIPAFPVRTGVTAGFTTRRGGVSPKPYDSLNLGLATEDSPRRIEANWSLALASSGLSRRILRIPRLCHGDALIDAEQCGPESEADAVFTRSDRFALAVTAADCLPVLLWDPLQGTIAAVHAGWRGTRLGILRRTLERLALQGLLTPASTLIALGPCLRHCLELGAEIADTLPERSLRREDDTICFDLAGENRLQALDTGVPADNIFDTGACTWLQSDEFFSHRREKGVSGRTAAIIALASNGSR